MTGEQQLIADIAPEPRRLMAHGTRTLVSIGFVVLHVAGGAYAIATLMTAWRFRLLLRLLLERGFFSHWVPLPWSAVPVGVALVVLLAAVAVGRTIWRWARSEPEQDIGLRARALVYVALACLFANAFYLSTPETFAGPFRVRNPMLAQISAAFAYGAYVVWSLLLPRLKRTIPDRVRRGVDVLGMNAVLIVVLAEISLRVVARFSSSPLLVTSSTQSDLRRDSDRQPPGSLRFGYRMNQTGHYDTDFVPRAASPVIVGIGDSFSYGAVPHPYHFTTVAERHLPGVAIYNMGYPGTGPSDYLYLFEQEALPLAPDVVVINLFVGNDVTSSRSPAGPARWHDADSYLVAIVWYRLRIMRRAKLVDVARTKSANVTQDGLTAAYPWLADPMLEQPALSSEVYFQMETRNAWGSCLPHPGLYEHFFQTLSEFERAAGDVRLAFMVIPDEFQVEDHLWEEVVRRSEQPLDRDLAQRTIVPWLKSRGLPVLDLLPLLRKVEPLKDGRRHLYHLQETHFNARGNEVAGRALASFVDSVLTAPIQRPRVKSQEPARPVMAPISLPFHVAFGDSGTRRLMHSGWSQDESSGGRSYVWNDGLQSVLWAPLSQQSEVRMSFEASPFIFPGSPQQSVTIVLNETVIGEVALRPGLRPYSVLLPRAAFVASPNLLAFRYAYARAPQEVLPNTPDSRMLAVAWYSINFARNP